MMKVLTLIQAHKICGTNRCRKQFLDPAALSTDIGLCQTDESNKRYYYPSSIQVSSIKKPLAYVVFNWWYTSLWFKMKLFFCWLRCKKCFFENPPLNLADKLAASWKFELLRSKFCFLLSTEMLWKLF